MTIDPKTVLCRNGRGDNPAYRIGGRVLGAIAPEAHGPVETIVVPIATDEDQPVESGIVSRSALLQQLSAARSAIARQSSTSRGRSKLFPF